MTTQMYVHLRSGLIYTAEPTDESMAVAEQWLQQMLEEHDEELPVLRLKLTKSSGGGTAFVRVADIDAVSVRETQ